MTDEKHIKYHLDRLGYKSYKEYLQSQHWLVTKDYFYSHSQRILMMRRSGGICCEFCRTKGKVNLHHKTYERLGNERCTDLIILCDDCHQQIHDLPRNIKLPHRTRKLRRLTRRIRDEIKADKI